MSNKTQLLGDHVDDHVDEEIKLYFSKEKAKSFFVSAGAGSGKTRSLINTLLFLEEKMGDELAIHGKRVAVITYTNAACDEISRRLQYKPIFNISTIHSFLWELIKDYQEDIKQWVIKSTSEKISELNEKQMNGRGGEGAVKRAEEIQRKTERLAKISTIKKFSYNPNGDNMGYDSLNHTEVIKMGSEFIKIEETMQNILVSEYPVLLIDESQDTKKELVDALFTVLKRHNKNFIVGMFGDTMQKIYMDGVEDLSKSIPADWGKPVKIMNHRSAGRIVDLANAIRATVDGQKQKARSDAVEGVVRLFLVSSTANKEGIERQIVEMMSKETGDNEWLDIKKYKSLILEHHMAASRFSFSSLYETLDKSKSFDTSLRDGSIPELLFLSNTISPLVVAYKSNNNFEISRIVRRSPLLNKKVLSENPDKQVQILQDAEDAVKNLFSRWKSETDPTCLDVYRSIKKTRLFEINSRVDDILLDFVEGEDKKVTALRTALSVPFSELERYASYVAGNTPFATHQGIKGLEFPRVMVIMDDAQSRGFLFSFEKLFGAKAETVTDLSNKKEARDTSIMRTTRLFYVACTRAQKSLAVIDYTKNVAAVKSTAISNGWFFEKEIIIL